MTWQDDYRNYDAKMGEFDTRVPLSHYVGYLFAFVLVSILAGVGWWIQCGMVKAGVEQQTKEQGHGN